MDEDLEVRFLFSDPNAAHFVYRPPNSDSPAAQDATTGIKFSFSVRILDEWWLIGGTKWSRTLFRLRHPIVYSKRGLRNLWRRIKRVFVKEPPAILCRRWVDKKDLLKDYPEK